ncbi:hypothetical protein BCR44DRAFT_1261929 [Catenaria anguillulae PL171]|uniref:Secreted protein n=1 Tax=Catenaria anguillulae PL171 TaxID=765915 RepID=A0A1Y2HAU1_9FUNG|nr:hypothetical protein BCR44DRAFT_1261929 [Catenaria anguillulae PL171]
MFLGSSPFLVVLAFLSGCRQTKSFVITFTVIHLFGHAFFSCSHRPDFVFSRAVLSYDAPSICLFFARSHIFIHFSCIFVDQLQFKITVPLRWSEA